MINLTLKVAMNVYNETNQSSLENKRMYFM